MTSGIDSNFVNFGASCNKRNLMSSVDDEINALPATLCMSVMTMMKIRALLLITKSRHPKLLMAIMTYLKKTKIKTVITRKKVHKAMLQSFFKKMRYLERRLSASQRVHSL